MFLQLMIREIISNTDDDNNKSLSLLFGPMLNVSSKHCFFYSNLTLISLLSSVMQFQHLQANSFASIL